MKTIDIVSAVGARPNFMKIAPFVRAIAAFNAGSADARGVRLLHTLVHTGQHYDRDMSAGFFDELGIPAADINLGVGSGTHAEQLGRTMMAMEPVLQERRPDWLVVVGDINATAACAIVASRLHIPVAHIEAGLRSYDRSMPEELNRVITDHIADLLFTPEPFADHNLSREGIPPERIRRVGNIMIDTLAANRDAAGVLDVAAIVAGKLLPGQPPLPEGPGGNAPAPFALLTLHRPANVDEPAILEALVRVLLDDVAARMPLVWTLHPRTRDRLETFGLWPRLLAAPRLRLVAPLSYREMLCLNMAAGLVLTDSGGLQEECCVLGTPCLTLRDTTERPITLREYGGSSQLVGNDPARIRAALGEIDFDRKHPTCPRLWDGQTAGRIVQALLEHRR